MNPTDPFQQRFHEALKQWLVRRNLDVETVIGYEDDSYVDGGCTTCGSWSVIEVLIKYIDSEGRSRRFEYEGSFSQILKELV